MNDKTEEQLTVSVDEWNILNGYYNTREPGEYRTMPEMAQKLKMTKAAFDRGLAGLRKKEWIAGQRKITLTAGGFEGRLRVMEVLQRQADEAVAKERAPEPEQAQGADAAMSPSSVPAVPESYNSQQSAPVRRPPFQPVTDQGVDPNAKLSDILASRLNVDPVDLFNVIKNNIIHTSKSESPPTNAEILQVMSVMKAYELDPFVKQVHAFRHKGKLQISVGVDGWTAIANRRPEFGGVEYEFPEEMVELPDGKMCWPWVKAICHVKGRVPTVKYAFLQEWYVETKKTDRGPSNWSMYPTHRIQGKAYTLSIKEAFGISLYDPSDVEQFHEIGASNVMVTDNGPLGAAEARGGEILAALKELESTEGEDQ